MMPYGWHGGSRRIVWMVNVISTRDRKVRPRSGELIMGDTNREDHGVELGSARDSMALD
jgi:hypothetical protein